MEHVVTQKCLSEVYSACVQVCPADCMHYVAAMPRGYPGEGQAMVVVDPDECIDCGLCEPECPIEAIYAEDEVPADQIEFIEINEKYSKIWPNIPEAKDPMPDHEDWKKKTNKIDILILE